MDWVTIASDGTVPSLAVDLGRVVAIEQAARSFDNGRQDWKAVLVMDSGARIPTGLFFGDALAIVKTNQRRLTDDRLRPEYGQPHHCKRD